MYTHTHIRTCIHSIFICICIYIKWCLYLRAKEVPQESCMLHQIRSDELSLKELHLSSVDSIILHHLAEDPAISLCSECVCVLLCSALQKYLS